MAVSALDGPRPKFQLFPIDLVNKVLPKITKHFGPFVRLEEPIYVECVVYNVPTRSRSDAAMVETSSARGKYARLTAPPSMSIETGGYN
ncbi:hypothetical protein IB277_13500 [Ensifer sp. ENS07]|uniref:hypothetical protein n=1 Tax=unclassified Ensifer TaxID=2633371 RepID=UPI001781A273|nr:MULTISPECIES: hypothetical protein [unclassified Ensifer]MBD9508187.1 hypothetical protein [Ensifer sp. ENS10]MBD9637321.1 hypothetical protein [Ensifer sp. ENS07]